MAQSWQVEVSEEHVRHCVALDVRCDSIIVQLTAMEVELFQVSADCDEAENSRKVIGIVLPGQGYLRNSCLSVVLHVRGGGVVI